MIKIPFNRAFIRVKDRYYLEKALSSGHLSGNGKYTKECEKILTDTVGCKNALLTSSCTDALEICALLLDLKPGDEVILPSYTFVSVANAFVLRGAKPVFVDIHPHTLNLNENLVEQAINKNTKAIVVVHYGGVAANLKKLIELADQYRITLIEDNAHGLYGKYQKKELGTFGALSTLSFHETKNFTCGEGGALLINDEKFIERAEIIREKGTDRSKFLRGQVDKYTWVDYGSSFIASELNAALLLSQLESRNTIQSKRKRIFETYEKSLATWARKNGVVLPTIPGECDPAYHMFFLLLPTASQQERFIAHMKEAGILAIFHYQPLHTSKMGKRFGGKMGDCPVSEDISQRIVRLPFYTGLTKREQNKIIQRVLAF